MKKILVLFILTIMTILPTFATHWVQTGKKSYIDIDSIEQFVDDYGNIVHSQYAFWTKFLNDGGNDFKDMEKIYNKKIWYIMCKHKIDINKKSYAVKEIIYYDLNRRVIEAHSYADFEVFWRSIIPDTEGYLEYLILGKILESKE